MRSALGGFLFVVAPMLVSGQTATLRPDSGPPEDPKLRAEAVRLMERATKVSTPAVWPPNVMTLRFRVTNPEPGYPYEGEYVSSVGGPGLRRQEWHYGDYQLIQVRNGKRLSFSNNTRQPTVVVHLLNQMAPIFLGQFDQQDIIRSIVDSGEHVRCIQFETVTGDHQQQANEACVDSRNGWLLSIRTGDVTTRNSNFFPFQDAFLPGHIERWQGGQLVMQVDESVELKSDFPPDFFFVPENSNGGICPELRRPYAVNTPDPPPGTSSIDVIEVKLQGLVSDTGRVWSLKPLDLAHPELNEEAMKLVSTWTFSPATCDGKPVTFAMVFTVHFKGR